MWEMFWWTSAVGLNSVCNTFAVVSHTNGPSDDRKPACGVRQNNDKLTNVESLYKRRAANVFLSQESTDTIYQVSTEVHHDAVAHAVGVYGLYDHTSLGKGLVSYAHKPLTGVR